MIADRKKKIATDVSKTALISVFIIVCLFLAVIGSVGLVRFAGARPASNQGWIVYVRGADAASGLWVMNTNGERQRQLTNIRDGEPKWSPDGRQVAFTRLSRDDPESRGIYVINADGSNVRRPTDGSYDGQSAWSPDGQRIAFSRQVREEEDRDADGDNQEVLNDSGRQPAWSPDGKKIAFSRFNMTGGRDIRVMDANGANVKRLTDGGSSVDALPRWSPDGAKIVFNSNRSGLFKIHVRNADGSEIRQLTQTPVVEYEPDWTAYSYAVEAAGKLRTTWGKIKAK